MTHDDFEDRLRRELADSASRVQPAGDGLARIRERIADQAGRPWWQPALAGAAAVAVVAAGAVGVAALLDDDGGDQVTAVAPTPTSSATTPTTSPSSTPAAPATSPSATSTPTSATVGGPPDVCRADGTSGTGAVYRVADVAGEWRLYREFVPLGPVTACSALTAALTGEPTDPDYTSLWPAGTTVESVTVDGDTADVTLSAAALDASRTQEQTAASLQQLVYTVTAADSAVRSVRLLVDGTPIDALWGHDIDNPVQRAPLRDVQGQIWIIDPAQGSQTSSPVTVRVFGTGFEGNIVLTVFDAQGTQVEGTFVTTAMDDYAEGTTQIKLPPGTYTLRASNETGDSGDLVERDSKTFTVR